jgi:fatty-acyl-CoA synthase
MFGLNTPTLSVVPTKNDFRSVIEALDYAALAGTGVTFCNGRGEPETVLRYEELRDATIFVGARLQGLALGQGARVGLIGETGPEFVTAFLACIRVGLVPVPLPVPGVFSDPERYADQISRQLVACGARLLLTPSALSNALYSRATDGRVRRISWDALVALPAAEEPIPHIRSDDLCYIQYSSGSTRFPRGVAVTHAALMRNCHDIAVHGVASRPGDRVVSWLPLYHDMGLVGALIASLCAQVCVDLLATEHFVRRPLAWLQLLSRNRGTIAYSPCFGYDLCCRRAQPAQIEGLDLSHWRVAGVGAELIDPVVMERFAQTFAPAGFDRRSILVSYGLAEATLAVSFSRPGSGLRTETLDRAALAERGEAEIATSGSGRSFACCGRPLPGQEIEIRGASGQSLPPRRVGRVFLRGESVMRGYFRDEFSTSAVLDGAGWLDTGDVGYLAEGELVIVGRSKETIIVKGRNIWPQDLEWIAEQVEEVRTRDCAAFGVHESGRGERAVVLIQCRSVDPAAREALSQAVHRAILHATGLDCRIVPVPHNSLPRTSSGKLNRALARQRYEAEAFESPAAAPEAAPWGATRIASAG